jgi:DNA-binding HxlR family transcriptional regulator
VEAKRRVSARITHRLHILRAHGIIRRVPRAFRYVMTDKGRQIATAIIHTQHIPITRISELAA